MATAHEQPSPTTGVTHAKPQKLAPEVVERLQRLQQSSHPATIDDILKAANLTHLTVPQNGPRPVASKSAELPSSATPQKSASVTLAERRRIPASTEKLKLYAQIATGSNAGDDNQVLRRLEQENADLPALDAECDIIDQIERQQALMASGHKTFCIDVSALLPIVEANEFWHCLVADYPRAAPKLSRLLVHHLRQEGIPAEYRGAVWQAIASSSDTHLAALYKRLVQGDMGISSYDKAIEKDVAQMMESNELAQATARILKAYSVYDAHVGYCQGLAYLVRPLLMTMSESQAFSTFVRLMDVYEMRTLFTFNMDGLDLRLRQFQAFLDQHCPRLHYHLTENAIHPPMYASRWFLTLFAQVIPTRLILRLYDLVFVHGAFPTMIRVAVALLHKHEEKLLALDQFESLMSFLASGDLAQDTDLVEQILQLSTSITREKMDGIADTYRQELEQEKTRAEQLLAVRFKNKKANRRESWFGWGANSPRTCPPQTEANLTSPPMSPTVGRQSQDRATSVLHQQIEDLVTALSQLQKEHSQMTQEMTSLKLREMDYESERGKLCKRNALLEKRVKKYKAKIAKLDSAPSGLLPPLSSTLPPTHQTEKSRLETLEQDAEFKSFVESLRMSGDFGELIAGALTSSNLDSSTKRPSKEDASRSTRSSVTTYRDSQLSSSQDSENDTVATTVVADSPAKTDVGPLGQDDQQAVQHITSELVNVKLLQFETDQKYSQLVREHDALCRRLDTAESERRALLQQVSHLQEQVQALQAEKEEILQEHEDWARENQDLLEKSIVGKRTAAELQFEKMALVKQVEQLEKRAQALEREKKEYLMPRGTFSEEVFAAHQALFGQSSQDEHTTGITSADTSRKDRRHTLQVGYHADKTEYQAKYVESDLRCRELEKLLAEAKVKLAEYEAASMPLSPRASLQHGRPLSAIHMKRTSTASLSMLASRVTSPTTTDPSHPRDSSESYASSITSATSMGSAANMNKRSSMYTRLWNSFGSTQVPGKPIKYEQEELCQEPLHF